MLSSIKIRNVFLLFIVIFFQLLISRSLYAGVLSDLGNYLCYEKEVKWEKVISPELIETDFVHSIKITTKNFLRDYGYCREFTVKEDISNKNLRLLKVHYDIAVAEFKIYLKSDLVSGFFDNGVKFQNDSFKKIENDLSRLPGEASMYVVKDEGKVFYEYNADKPLALGSTFKLYILKALEDQISSGKYKWSDVVIINKKYFSYPSGIMQDWPDDTPITLKALAIMMISISDNTATDILIDFLGRELIEKYSPRNKPFLKTKEMFVLKHFFSESKRREYLKSDEQKKRKILSEIDLQTKRPLLYDTDKPVCIDTIEWFATTNELCDLIFEFKNNDVIEINSGGLIDKDNWQYIGYKGGSESGVLQFTNLLQSKNGKWYCISTTWNDPAGKYSGDEMIEILMSFQKRSSELLMK